MIVAIHSISLKIMGLSRQFPPKGSHRAVGSIGTCHILDTAMIILYNAHNAMKGTSTRAQSPQRAFGRCEKAAKRRRIHPEARFPKGNRVGGRRCAGYSAQERCSCKGYAREGISMWKWYRVSIAFLLYGDGGFCF